MTFGTTDVDDSQIYDSCHPNDSRSLRTRILDCKPEFNDWMASNRLILNPAQTEFIGCSTSHLVDQVNLFLIDSITVPPVMAVKLLGVHIDSNLTITTRVSYTVSVCFYELRRMKAARLTASLKGHAPDLCLLTYV